MNPSPNNPKSHPLLKPAWIVCLVLGMVLLLGACTAPEPPISQVVIISPTPPPPSPPPTTIPTSTPYPEGTIAWGAIFEDTSPEDLEFIETWARILSETTGLDVILVPYPETAVERLEALRDGRIHMVTIHPLTYLVGNERGWVEPGPIWGEQEAEAIMFISRTDTGFLPGEPPEVFQQLEGSRACWPETKYLDPNQKPYYALPSYILPLGLLRLNEVENVEPVLTENLSYERRYPYPVLERPVFNQQCEFAAISAVSPENFMSFDSDIDPSEWEEQMQILYTTEPINPRYSLYGFSSTLPEAVRESLSLAIIATLGLDDIELNPFNETLFDEFRRIVLASELDLQSFLSAPVDEP